MTSPSAPPDLSKLRINRDVSPTPLRRAWRRNLAIGLVALAIAMAVIVIMRRGGGVTVQTAVATPISGGGEPGSMGAGVRPMAMLARALGHPSPRSSPVA